MVDGVRKCHELLPTFFQRGLGPGFESCSRSGNSPVNVLLGRYGNFSNRLGGGRVDAMTSFGGLGQLVVDNVVVSLECQLVVMSILDAVGFHTSNSSLGICPFAPLVTPFKVAEGDMTIIAAYQGRVGKVEVSWELGELGSDLRSSQQSSRVDGRDLLSSTAAGSIDELHVGIPTWSGP